MGNATKANIDRMQNDLLSLKITREKRKRSMRKRRLK